MTRSPITYLIKLTQMRFVNKYVYTNFLSELVIATNVNIWYMAFLKHVGKQTYS